MKDRPLPVIIVSVVFIIAGVVGFVSHLKEFSGPDAKLYELLWIESISLIAIVCGLLLLMSINWARWLAIAWLLFHVIISAFHSTTEMILHIVFLLLVAVLLYLPQTSAYFEKKNKQ